VDRELERWLDAAFEEIEPRIRERAAPKISAGKTQGPAMPSSVGIETDIEREHRQ
jgi:hypothetical protein